MMANGLIRFLRTISITFATAAACSIPVSATAATDPATALNAAVAEYNRAQQQGDRPALQRLLADDYILVTRNAAIKTKAELIADLTDTGLKLDSYVIEHPHRISSHDGLLLASEVHLHGMRGGQPFAAHIRLIDFWRLRAGHWQVVFSQVTPFAGGS